MSSTLGDVGGRAGSGLNEWWSRYPLQERWGPSSVAVCDNSLITPAIHFFFLSLTFFVAPEGAEAPPPPPPSIFAMPSIPGGA